MDFVRIMVWGIMGISNRQRYEIFEEICGQEKVLRRIFMVSEGFCWIKDGKVLGVSPFWPRIDEATTWTNWAQGDVMLDRSPFQKVLRGRWKQFQVNLLGLGLIQL